jgi:hypothetical protein
MYQYRAIDLYANRDSRPRGSDLAQVVSSWCYTKKDCKHDCVYKWSKGWPQRVKAFVADDDMYIWETRNVRVDNSYGLVTMADYDRKIRARGH